MIARGNIDGNERGTARECSLCFAWLRFALLLSSRFCCSNSLSQTIAWSRIAQNAFFPTFSPVNGLCGLVWRRPEVGIIVSVSPTMWRSFRSSMSLILLHPRLLYPYSHIASIYKSNIIRASSHCFLVTSTSTPFNSSNYFNCWRWEGACMGMVQVQWREGV
jgi:hypothetical protein